MSLQVFEGVRVRDIVDEHNCVGPEKILIDHAAGERLAAEVPQLERQLAAARHHRPLQVEVHPGGRLVLLGVHVVGIPAAPALCRNDIDLS